MKIEKGIRNENYFFNIKNAVKDLFGRYPIFVILLILVKTPIFVKSFF